MCPLLDMFVCEFVNLPPTPPERRRTVPSLCAGRVKLSLEANPGHLEAVSPVMNGKARATQLHHGDNKKVCDSFGLTLGLALPLFYRTRYSLELGLAAK